MNIIEAIKSGKRFRRRGEDFYYDLKNELHFIVDEVMADDWEIEEDKIVVKNYCVFQEGNTINATFHIDEEDSIYTVNFHYSEDNIVTIIDDGNGITVKEKGKVAELDYSQLGDLVIAMKMIEEYAKVSYTNPTAFTLVKGIKK